MEMLAYGAIVVFVAFIGYKVYAAKKNKPTGGDGTGRSWMDDKYPNQDKE